ncbi:gamma-glutamyl-gamma-aminobutyrate hydrolase family protein [Pseudodesulfovibrio sp. zrk46]|uniref:gamma-glutamyl-gamma-aminobutyrate hydrolase family protein n=1 Tax=Pseudodesulfovibrio sp. zrk46 TaxID=2725288 RepID=UPI0014498237|nr:gamma-glutamyl-gamma-aminobutyrate hydrolase family protein [Pseudodesulfovibrio sp. zrk46]QJB56743.1 gamma-glutamyl-gamma-aminobutyrate hydrolase family protein [Pseudodesulfovibrio sp. zrk46]
MKPVIAIVPNLEKSKLGMICNMVTKTYTDAIIKGGALPFILPATMDRQVARDMLATAHGVLFVGGMDVAPSRYGEEPIMDLMDAESELDDIQFMMAEEALNMDLPILGICRGAQVVNVALGGTLHQDVPTDFPESTLVHLPVPLAPSAGHDHNVVAEEGSVVYKLFGETIPVNSVHHQSIKEVGEGLRITARATDGVIEAAEHESRPVMVVQWHPEMMLTVNDDMLPLFEHFTGVCAERMN